MTPSPLIEYALAYARQGLRIFPCHHPIHLPNITQCSCRNPNCKNTGKHPRIKGWQENATEDPARIEKFWQQFPNSNIGLPTGAPNNLDVLDEDPKHGGDRSLIELQEQFGQLPQTLTSKTGSGGHHIFFQHVPGVKNNNTGKIKPGIDYKTTGGYVVIPPSLHPSGNNYNWEQIGETPAQVPSWLLQILRQEFPTRDQTKRHDQDHWTSLAHGATAGDRHNAIASVAGLLLQTIDSKHLAIALTHGYNLACCDPPKSTQEVNNIINWIAHQHLKRAKKNGN